MHFSFYRQLNEMDCGPTCLRMITKYYGRHYSADSLRYQSGLSTSGVNLLGLSETAEKLGFRTRGVQITFEKLLQAPLPGILHWRQDHFVVLISVNKKRVKIADPARGIISYSRKDFLKYWTSNEIETAEQAGIILLMEPTPAFYENDGEIERKLSWGIILSYMRPHKYRLFQVFLSLIIASTIQLILPFLTQSMVDTGINTRNLHFITIVLIAQLTLAVSSSVIELIRNRLQLKISNTINISILSDFWIKLTSLPISYFDVHRTGDTLQRIQDNRQVQSFLTGQTITVLFSILNFIVYSFILVFYDLTLFLVFVSGSVIYFCWIQLFMRIRRKLNYKTFHISSLENSSTLQFVQGMQEIKLNNAEKLKRWDWENIQIHVFKLNFKSLNYNQWQITGAMLINQGKDILLSFMVAQLVIRGQLTFGTMLAIQYIIGQLNSPISQFVGFSQNLQDAKISMERLNEIHQLQDEEPVGDSFLHQLPESRNISIRSLSFSYPGSATNFILENINLEIPEGKITAIVGSSGSGKTTLLKLLLKIYTKYNGVLKIGTTDFNYISPSFWRSQCGAVLQDGFIFNDSIARNIAVGDEFIDQKKLIHSCHIANIISFIENLPNGFNTKLGADGMGVSQGQKQRILIARALYKDPQYLFFDEATNALDANNEKTIVEQLNDFFKGRTVIIVAHRLSTVRNADKIVVMDRGKIVEEGDHNYLTSIRGKYYELVKNQIEMGA